ncbi:MAG: tRNA (adenosine(37)-N6)-threonylcarbamoyltransferase complex dimerization subunit type 1 TsaB, partial [Rubrivivax sp.]
MTPATSSTAPRLLAFDTSTETMAITACGPAGAAGWVGPGGAAASATLLVRAHEVLAAAGLSLPELDAVAFGAGPGAFTGLRTACAVAQGLAFGLDRPVLAIDSLALVAEDTGWHDGAPVWVAMDARMDELYVAAYRWHGTGGVGWRPETAPALVPLDVLVARWAAQPPARVAGSGLRAFGARLPTGGAELRPHEHDRAAALP